jgi:hypothetical protein
MALSKKLKEKAEDMSSGNFDQKADELSSQQDAELDMSLREAKACQSSRTRGFWDRLLGFLLGFIIGLVILYFLF